MLRRSNFASKSPLPVLNSGTAVQDGAKSKIICASWRTLAFLAILAVVQLQNHGRVRQGLDQDTRALSNSSNSVGNHQASISSQADASALLATPRGKDAKFDSNAYWEQRYKSNYNSGKGSYGTRAAYKAKIINEIVSTYSVHEVAEFGCGDGNNLKLYDAIQMYTGYDVSSTAIEARKKEWGDDPRRKFIHFDGTLAGVSQQYDLTMSLDVLFHLIEVPVFEAYLEALFLSAKRYVLIYARDEEIPDRADHVLFRRFTPYIQARFDCWELAKSYENPGLGSPANFFFYKRKDSCALEKQ